MKYNMSITPCYTHVYLFRHGQTDYNKTGRFQGQSVDSPLNADGIAQAKLLARQTIHIHLDKIVSSPLLRARQTAEIICDYRKIPLIIDDRLVETSFGAAEGKLKNELDSLDMERHYNFRDPDFAWPNGESHAAVSNRIYDALTDIVRTYERQSIGISSHGNAIANIFARFAPKKEQVKLPKNAEVYHGLADNYDYLSYLLSVRKLNLQEQIASY